MASNIFAFRVAKFAVAGTSTGTGVEFGKVRNGSLNVNAPGIDVTSVDSGGWRELIDGIKSWTMEAESVAMYSTAVHAQDDLRDALSSGTRQWITMNDSTGTGGSTWEGYGYITGWQLGGSHDDAWIHNFTIESDGALSGD